MTLGAWGLTCWSPKQAFAAARSTRFWSAIEMNESLAKSGDPRRLPSVDQVLQTSEAGEAIARFGRPMVKQAARDLLAEARRAHASPGAASQVGAAVLARLVAAAPSSLRPVFNLTGTVLHTNLG